MIKNVKLKVFLQNTVFTLFSWLNQRKHHDSRKIMLYSNMGFRDNVKALYDYLIDAGYNQKYKIICSTNDYKMYNKDLPSNVIFVSNIRGVLLYFSAGFARMIVVNAFRNPCIFCCREFYYGSRTIGM